MNMKKVIAIGALAVSFLAWRMGAMWNANPVSYQVVTTLTQSEGLVSAAIARDKILTVNKSSTAKLWDARTGALRSWLNSPDILAVGIFSHNGDIVVTGADDGTVNVWNANSNAFNGTLMRSYKETQGINALTFSPNDQFLAICYGKVARIRYGDDSYELEGYEDKVVSAAFSWDNTRVVISSEDGSATIWNVASGDMLVDLKHDYPVFGAEFSPDNTYVVTASENGARIWDAQTGALLGTFEEDSEVYLAKYSPN